MTLKFIATKTLITSVKSFVVLNPAKVSICFLRLAPKFENVPPFFSTKLRNRRFSSKRKFRFKTTETNGATL